MKPYFKSLNAKIYATLLIVIIPSAFIYISWSTISVRYDVLQGTIDDAKTALIAASGDKKDQEDALQYVGARAIYKHGTKSSEGIYIGLPPIAQKTFFIDSETISNQIYNTLDTLFETNDTIIRVIGKGLKSRNETIEAIIYERPLRDIMWRQVNQILLITILLSLFILIALSISLRLSISRPIHQLSAQIEKYKKHPLDISLIIAHTDRKDDVGMIQNELASLQNTVSETLKRQDRLAAIGSSVSKINHDLRHIIAVVSMLIDGLESKNSSPKFKKTIQKIFDSLDKAISLCSTTMDFAKKQKINYQVKDNQLLSLFDTQIENLSISLDIPKDIYLIVDPLHFGRIISNLIENSHQAEATEISILSRITTIGELAKPMKIEEETSSEFLSRIYDEPSTDSCLLICFSDNGKGFSKKALENLFQPFRGSTKKDGNGLGLPLSRETINDLGGSLDLISSSAQKTSFHITFPKKYFFVKS